MCAEIYGISLQSHWSILNLTISQSGVLRAKFRYVVLGSKLHRAKTISATQFNFEILDIYDSQDTNRYRSSSVIRTPMDRRSFRGFI